MANELILSQSPQWNSQQIELLKNTLCKGISNEEFEIFLHACKRTGLDPFMRQIYAVKRKSFDKNSGKYIESMVLQVGIDGYRLVAERTGCYCPGREPTFSYDDKRNLVSATSYVKKLTKDGTWHEVAATAYFSEYCQRDKDGNPLKFWKDMPYSQLAKCAESLALRKGFPAELSGIYTKEEMEQADVEVIETKPEPQLTEEEIQKFYSNFNGDKGMTEAYVKFCADKKKWSLSKTIINLQQDLEASHKAYKAWEKKQKPVQVTIETPSVESVSVGSQIVFEEVK